MTLLSKFPHQPYIVAELGVNHGGSRPKAEALIRLAAAAGADAVKFQVYKAAQLAARESPIYFHQTGEPLQSQQQFFAQYDALEPADYRYLADVAHHLEVEFLCTPFDVAAVAWLDPLVPMFKVASGDITHWPLLQAIAQTGKPVLLSTGASTWDEIDRAVRWLLEGGCPQVTVLHCVLAYPTANASAYLNLIPALAKRFPSCGIGYSDHTLPQADSLYVAWLLGAQVLEKHFTDDRTQPGNDHYHSMTGQDLKALRGRMAAAAVLRGNTPDRGNPLLIESQARVLARRSLYAAHDLAAGHILTVADLVAKRPAVGLEPFYLPQVLGRELAQDLDEDQVVTWPHLA